MLIRALDLADEGGLRAWYDLLVEAEAVDHPEWPPDPWEEHRESYAATASRRFEVWLAEDGGHLLGVAVVELSLLDNLDTAAVEVLVRPRDRRRGVGRALSAHAEERVRRLGRRRILAEVAEPLTHGAGAAGPSFAAAMGFQRALDEIRRVLDLSGVDDARLDALEKEAREHAGGYEVLSWVDVAPEEVVDDLALLMGRMSTDAPMGDVVWEPEAWDAARLREQEASNRRTGRRQLVAAARHVASGRLAAFTVIAVSRYRAEPGYQWDTLVAPDHRGHRLGTLVKVENLRALRRESPGTLTLHTWNAESNTHMVAVNEAMGFRPVERLAEWQREL